MPNSTNYQGNANTNKNYNEYHFISVRMAIMKNMRDKCWQRYEKREPFCTVCGIVNWFSHNGKQFGGSSKDLNRTTIWSAIPFYVYTQRLLKKYIDSHVYCKIIFSNYNMVTTYVHQWIRKMNDEWNTIQPWEILFCHLWHGWTLRTLS